MVNVLKLCKLFAKKKKKNVGITDLSHSTKNFKKAAYS